MIPFAIPSKSTSPSDRLATTRALVSLRGKRVSETKLSMGTICSIDFEPNYYISPRISKSGRLSGGYQKGTWGLFLDCVDWEMRIGDSTMKAMEKSASCLRRWLERLNNLRLFDGRVGRDGTLTLRFERGASLRAWRDEDFDACDWSVSWQPIQPRNWSDFHSVTGSEWTRGSVLRESRVAA